MKKGVLYLIYFLNLKLNWQDLHLELFTNLEKGLAKGGTLCLTKRGASHVCHLIFTFNCDKGDLEELFPWPAGFYEKVTEMTEHTVSEVIPINSHLYKLILVGSLLLSIE